MGDGSYLNVRNISRDTRTLMKEMDNPTNSTMRTACKMSVYA